MRLRTEPLGLLLLLAVACGGEEYNPDWSAEAPVSGGKADGLLDHLPALKIGGKATEGDVGGERMELYVLDLKRTDRVEITMTVLSGNLNPHLSVYAGTSSYVRSETWKRRGETLTKTYLADTAGPYLVATRAYRGEGDGRYSLAVACKGGPCAGQFPTPGSAMVLGDVEDCLSQARKCAFDDLPRWNGRVGAARAKQIFDKCLETVSLSDGSSCKDACSWEMPRGRDWDHAAPHCASVIAALPFYADQSTACIAEFNSCFSACEDVGGWQNFSSSSFGETVEATCFSGGLNSNCDVYARGMKVCGGTVVAHGAMACENHCMSTSGAWIDDTSDICDAGGDDCAQYCDVELGVWAADCGPLAMDTRDCFRGLLDAEDAWVCEDALQDAIDGL